MTPRSVDEVTAALAEHDYLADAGLATAIFLALELRRPLLLEGEAGAGKTEVAKVLARWTGAPLLRLQCYEGIDVAQAVYEWDYSRQLLHLRAAEAAGEATAGADQLEDELYSERFLVRRPLLQAIAPADHDGPVPVLLIDEVDRADDEFEAFLLEILSDYTVTVPELGTFRAEQPPVVVITSNRTRDVHDALKRRCLYHWVDQPDFEREVAIVRLRAPEVAEPLARQVAAAVESVRAIGLYKPPGVAETIDWAQALSRLGRTELDADAVGVTLGTVLKYREDQERVRAAGLDELVRQAARAVPEAAPPDVAGEAVAVRFVRALRAAGLPVPAGSTVAYAKALGAVDAGRSAEVYWAGRATLVHRREDVPVYDAAFASYWGDAPPVVAAADPVVPVTVALDDAVAPDDEAGAGDEQPTLAVRWSATEVLRTKDSAACTDAELDELARLMAMLRVSGAPDDHDGSSRPAADRGRLDLRRTVRRSLRAGGEPAALARRSPSVRDRHLVVLVDISGSMEPYARALLRFAHAAVAGRGRVDAFALGTRLTRLTRALASRDPDRALAAAAAEVRDWSGGTRLGDGIRAFNDEWGVRGMARGATVVVLSDGWDRGDPEVLAEQMARLQRVAHRVVWVNPLKSSPGYAPLAAGMAAALPHVDDFVEGHSLASLERLAELIAR